MDLFFCNTCEKRFLALEGGPADGRRCPHCNGPLELMAMSIPGKPEVLPDALAAEMLGDRRAGMSGRGAAA